MVVAPLARFAARNLRARRDVIPIVGTVINRVQQQALMLRVGAQIGFFEQPIQNRQARLEVALAVLLALVPQITAKAQKSLGGNRRRRGIDRFVIVEGIGGLRLIIAELMQIGRAGIPVRNAILGGILDPVVAGRARDFEPEILDRLPSAVGFQFVVGQRRKEFELFGIAGNDPRLPARPSRERRVALLRTRATVIAVIGVEDSLMRRAAALVPAVAALAVPDDEFRRDRGVIDQTLQQRDLLVALFEQ